MGACKSLTVRRLLHTPQQTYEHLPVRTPALAPIAHVGQRPVPLPGAPGRLSPPLPRLPGAVPSAAVTPPLIFSPFCCFSFRDRRRFIKWISLLGIENRRFHFLSLTSGAAKEEALSWCVVVFRLPSWTSEAGVVRQHPYEPRLPITQKPLGETFMMCVVMSVIIQLNRFT